MLVAVIDPLKSPSTLSAAVAPASVYPLPASTVATASPASVITGGVVSTTVRTKFALALDSPSLTVTVMMASPA